MRSILRFAGAAALAMTMSAGLAACDPDDLADVALPTVKAAAVKVAIGAAAGDTRAREIVLGIADGYCEVAEADRLALRAAFTAADGRPAFAVDCAAVKTIVGRVASRHGPPAPGPHHLVRTLALLTPEPPRRE